MSGTGQMELDQYLFSGVQALQHRGQDGAGVAYYNPKRQLVMTKTSGLVDGLFQKLAYNEILPQALLCHLRYATVAHEGDAHLHPFRGMYQGRPFALAHNGNITQYAGKSITEFGTGITDSETVVRLIEEETKGNFEEVLVRILKRLTGSFAFLILYDQILYGVRDSLGIRPLVIGKNKKGTYFLASESCSFSGDIVYQGELAPGEIVKIENQKLSRYFYAEKTGNQLCTMELIYFSRIDSHFGPKKVYALRKEIGRLLAKQKPVVADVVIPIPESSKAVAEGYAEDSKIPYSEGIRKNPYVGRSFIEKNQQLRERTVAQKFIFVEELIRDKEIVLVDDSIIRGTTIKKVVANLREIGAKKIHIRIGSPVVKHVCDLGISFSTTEELLATTHTVAEMKEYLGVESLEFFELGNLQQVCGSGSGCFQCFQQNKK